MPENLPVSIPELTEAIASRLWARVKRVPGGCWEWDGGTGSGYGRMKIGNRLFSTHRIAYEAVNGPIPEGEWVLHHCDNPRCCNPAHLFTGDRSANMQDCHRKGRLFSPERRYRQVFCAASRKLEPEDAREIRRAFAVGEATKAQLARQFGVSHKTIRQIIGGKTWKIAAAQP